VDGRPSRAKAAAAAAAAAVGCKLCTSEWLFLSVVCKILLSTAVDQGFTGLNSKAL